MVSFFLEINGPIVSAGQKKQACHDDRPVRLNQIVVANALPGRNPDAARIRPRACTLSAATRRFLLIPFSAKALPGRNPDAARIRPRACALRQLVPVAFRRTESSGTQEEKRLPRKSVTNCPRRLAA